VRSGVAIYGKASNIVTQRPSFYPPYSPSHSTPNTRHTDPASLPKAFRHVLGAIAMPLGLSFPPLDASWPVFCLLAVKKIQRSSCFSAHGARCPTHTPRPLSFLHTYEAFQTANFPLSAPAFYFRTSRPLHPLPPLPATSTSSLPLTTSHPYLPPTTGSKHACHPRLCFPAPWSRQPSTSTAPACPPRRRRWAPPQTTFPRRTSPSPPQHQRSRARGRRHATPHRAPPEAGFLPSLPPCRALAMVAYNACRRSWRRGECACLAEARKRRRRRRSNKAGRGGG